MLLLHRQVATDWYDRVSVCAQDKALYDVMRSPKRWKHTKSNIVMWSIRDRDSTSAARAAKHRLLRGRDLVRGLQGLSLSQPTETVAPAISHMPMLRDPPPSCANSVHVADDGTVQYEPPQLFRKDHTCEMGLPPATKESGPA